MCVNTLLETVRDDVGDERPLAKDVPLKLRIEAI